MNSPMSDTPRTPNSGFSSTPPLVSDKPLLTFHEAREEFRRMPVPSYDEMREQSRRNREQLARMEREASLRAGESATSEEIPSCWLTRRKGDCAEPAQSGPAEASLWISFSERRPDEFPCICSCRMKGGNLGFAVFESNSRKLRSRRWVAWIPFKWEEQIHYRGPEGSKDLS